VDGGVVDGGRAVGRWWGLRCTNGGRQRIQLGGGGYAAVFGLWNG